MRNVVSDYARCTMVPKIVCIYLKSILTFLENKKPLLETTRAFLFFEKTEIYFWFPDGIRRILQDEIYIGNIYSGKTKDKKRILTFRVAGSPQWQAR